MEEERRKANFVYDRPAETGIKVQNILTALVLGVMGWVGLNIENIKTNVGDIKLESKLNTKEIASLKERNIAFDRKISAILEVINKLIRQESQK